jgi:rhodanese-related sulfurtransferase
MKTAIKDAIILTLLSAALAFGINAISPNGIPLVGDWYDNRDKVELDIPPSYDASMDTLISLQEAFILWRDSSAVFIDAREPEDYHHGHIPGAINFPFDYWDDCWDRVEPLLSPGDTIVCYCGGFDCELSLFAARELKAIGYPHALIFFGGINKWEAANLPVEYGSEGTEYENDPAGDQK